MRARAAAAAAALLALGAMAGTVTYVAVSDGPPPTSSTTTATSLRPPTAAEVAAAVVGALERDLEVPLSRAEARCVGGALLSVVGRDAAEWVASPAPTLDPAQREALVGAVVACVPESKARALLGASTTTTTPDDLPDE